MAIVQRTAPNGAVINFDTEQFTEEQIQEYLQLPEYEKKQIEKTNKRNALVDIGFGAVDGVRDGVQATIGLVDDIGDTLGEKLNFGKFTFGDEANNGLIGFKKFDELTEEEKIERDKDFIELPDFEGNPDTIAGNLTKGVTQFLTGWFTGGRLLKGVKSFSKLGSLGQNVARGAVADFQAFDENTGRLVDLINDQVPSLQNPLFDYLSSDPDDSFVEARFKNALEGAGLGAVADGMFRTFRWYKNKKAEANGEPFNKQQLAEDEKFFSEAPTDKINPTKYRRVSDEFGKEVSKNLEQDLEDTIFNSFKDAQKNSKTRTDFERTLLDIDIASSFNLRKMVDMDKQGLISEDAFTKAYEKLIRSKKIVVSDEQVERTARKLYENNPNKLETDISELEKVLKQAPAKVVALNSYRNFLNVATRNLANISKSDPKAKELLLQVILPKRVLAQEQGLSIRGNIARTQRLSATASETQVARDQDTLIKDFKEYGGDVDEFIRKLGASGNADVTKVLQYASQNRTWDVLNEVWINALLSNPKTHIINMTSNVVNVFLKPLEKAIGSRLGIKGLENPAKVAKLRAEGSRAIGSYVGMGRYLKDAVRYAGIAFRKEDTVLTSRTKLDTPRKAIQKTKLVDGEEVLDDSITGKIINTTGRIVRYPSRFLNAEDELFKQVIYRAELEKYAVDEAIKAGASKTKVIASDIRSRQPITEFQQKVSDVFDEGFDEFGRAQNSIALRKAEEGTYTNELNGIFKRIADTTNEYPILKQILPFTRTPVNLMLNVVDRTPLGFIRKNYRDDFFGRNGAERMAQARGQLATGAILMYYADYLHSQGYITGVQGQIKDQKLTKSRELKDLSKSTGRLPYAFRYYDEESGTYKYRQFGRFDPFGSFFGLVADYKDFYNQLTQEEIERVGSNTLILLARQGGEVKDFINPSTKIANALTAGGSAVTRNLVSKTYLKGLADFMETITDDNPHKWERYAKSKVGSFIPNIYTKLVNDPFYRDTRSILDEVKRRSGLAEVETKYEFRGNPLEVQGDEDTRLINGLFNPFGASEQTNDPVADEILRLGVNIPSMKNVLKGDIDLMLFQNKQGQTAYNRLQELLRNTKIGGLSLDERLQQTINSSNYKRLSDPRAVDALNKDIGGKAKTLKSITKDYHIAVEQLLISEADKFFSMKDDTGKYSLKNSILSVNSNFQKLKMGIKLPPDALNSLYQFSK